MKKTGGAITLVFIHEDGLVDDIKEALLKKYTYNLERHYDAPYITVQTISSDKPTERVLNRTISYHYTDYFPLMPPSGCVRYHGG